MSRIKDVVYLIHAVCFSIAFGMATFWMFNDVQIKKTIFEFNKENVSFEKRMNDQNAAVQQLVKKLQGLKDQRVEKILKGE